jgi:predicted transcriptional regulator
MKRTLALFAALATIILAMSGCSRIESGNIGIVKHWGGKIDPEVATPGFHWMFFDSILAEVDTTPTRVVVNNLTPKDADGVPVDDLDIIVTYTLNPQHVSQFYSTTHELDTYKDGSNREYTTIGLEAIKQWAPGVMQTVTETDNPVAIAKNTQAYDEKASAEFKRLLDQRYPDAFLSVNVTTTHFKLPDSIQQQVNKVASFNAERESNAAELALIAQRKELARQKASIDAEALRAAADAAHLTPEQVIAWRNANAAQTQADNIGGVAKVIDVAKK